MKSSKCKTIHSYTASAAYIISRVSALTSLKHTLGNFQTKLSRNRKGFSVFRDIACLDNGWKLIAKATIRLGYLLNCTEWRREICCEISNHNNSIFTSNRFPNNTQWLLSVAFSKNIAPFDERPYWLYVSTWRQMTNTASWMDFVSLERTILKRTRHKRKFTWRP